MNVKLWTSPERLRELHRLLQDWAERASNEEQDGSKTDRRSFSALIAFSEDPE